MTTKLPTGSAADLESQRWSFSLPEDEEQIRGDSCVRGHFSVLGCPASARFALSWGLLGSCQASPVTLRISTLASDGSPGVTAGTDRPQLAYRWQGWDVNLVPRLRAAPVFYCPKPTTGTVNGKALLWASSRRFGENLGKQQSTFFLVIEDIPLM